jgi:hypothetical protein
MGDRANIVLDQENRQEIWLYTHWGGGDLPAVLQESLKRGKTRWTDEPYLGRIIFQDLTRGCEDELTGFGISSYMGDNDGYPYLRVDCKRQVVEVDYHSHKTNKVVPFTDFITIDGIDWEKLGFGDEY